MTTVVEAARRGRYLGEVGSLRSYRDKRDFRETPEPAGQAGEDQGAEAVLPRFVVQEHHARRLHWDFRLERDGVLVSWALPRGVPDDPKRNNLAVHVEDHPLEYGSFEGEIPRGNYGAGQVAIWDRGTYETHKWRMDGPKGEVMITLHGERVRGRYVLFQTDGKNWMIHRMDPPEDPDREDMPDAIEPMLARPADVVPQPDRGWAYEFKWDGARAVVFNDRGSLRVVSRNQEDLTRRYPELRGLAEALGSHSAVLDGEIVALAPDGIPRFEQLQQRIGLSGEAEIRRKMKQVPVYYFAFDLLYLDGRRLLDVPYRERRERLVALRLSGPSWQTPEHQEGHGAAMLEASRGSGLEGIVAKRLDSPYEQGRRSAAWLKIKTRRRQDLVIGGWLDGEGKREGLPGALLVGYWDGDRLVYAGRVGTGFTDATLARLADLMRPLARADSPFGRGSPPAKSHFVEPRLVGAFELADWTRANQVRAGAFKGLRDDVDPRRVVREGSDA
ncbi:MAG TPA: non-homologous end-joining DNA ligase [Candidatus Dormibacteraeota bacterium]|nr:non-homologous end-joining DNA ligase [Candidatus Dormibacteraeota bacterium]